MTEVILHIYDVTNSQSEKANNTIMTINKIFKDGIGLGGIFHSTIQVYGDDEWSFGYCEQGSGVFSCPSGQNTMYTYREKIVLGTTNFPIFKVNQILRELSREWPGFTYDLLARNCSHFCDDLCEKLAVPKIPGWVNRFANAGDTAMVVAKTTSLRVRTEKPVYDTLNMLNFDVTKKCLVGEGWCPVFALALVVLISLFLHSAFVKHKSVPGHFRVNPMTRRVGFGSERADPK